MLSSAKTMTTMSERSHLHRAIIRSSHDVSLHAHSHRAASPKRRLVLGIFLFFSSSIFPTLHSLGWETLFELALLIPTTRDCKQDFEGQLTLWEGMNSEPSG